MSRKASELITSLAQALHSALGDYNAQIANDIQAATSRLEVRLMDIQDRLTRIEKHLRLDEREAGEP